MHALILLARVAIPFRSPGCSGQKAQSGMGTPKHPLNYSGWQVLSTLRTPWDYPEDCRMHNEPVMAGLIAIRWYCELGDGGTLDPAPPAVFRCAMASESANRSRTTVFIGTARIHELEPFEIYRQTMQLVHVIGRRNLALADAVQPFRQRCYVMNSLLLVSILVRSFSFRSRTSYPTGHFVECCLAD
jgi:hypothetical protein